MLDGLVLCKLSELKKTISLLFPSSLAGYNLPHRGNGGLFVENEGCNFL